MPQNRKKLIDLFIGNISNAITHEILIESNQNKETEEIASHYQKEIETAMTLSKKYREKINPRKSPFIDKDTIYIKSKIENKVKSELNQRIRKGYKNINLELLKPLIEKYLKKFKIKKDEET